MLMSTYNGEEYLEEQLKSLFSQKNVEVHLVVRDDGSSDGTIAILNEYVRDGFPIEIPEELQGFHSDKGVGSSYLRLLRYGIKYYPNIQYFSFMDQDDVWLEDKLFRAVEHINRSPNEKVLYFSNKKIVDENLNFLAHDDIRFNSDQVDYLGKNDAYGCTMVFTRAFAEMVLTGPVENWPFLHDIVLEHVALATDTEIIHDSGETILYRQHITNVTGAKDSKLLTRKNITTIFSNRRHYKCKLTSLILKYYKPWISKEYIHLFYSILHYTEFKNGFYLIRKYTSAKNKTFKEKIRFIGMVVLRGI